MLDSLNLMGAHHGIKGQHRASRAVEQGQDRRPESPVQGQRHLGTTSSLADGTPGNPPMPFDGKRMIFGGFEPVVEVKA
jgi:hypothetical protein